MERVSVLLAKVLYGALFAVVAPVALLLWARAAGPAIQIPTAQSVFWGGALAVLGCVVLIAGMLALWRHGGGLPMNAFPPPRFVQSGVYALVPHPIYGGFVLVCGGLSICFGSAAGLWLVTPTAALACAALVLGYEQPDLMRRFGDQAAFGAVEVASERPATFLVRLRATVIVLLPWLAVYGMLWYTGRSRDAFSTTLPFEQNLPVLQWTEVFYASPYLVVLLTPFLVRSDDGLRRYVRLGVSAMFLVFSLYLFLPIFVPPRSFVPANVLGRLLALEHEPYAGAAAFPSFHVVWALIVASVLGAEGRVRGWFWWTWAILVTASCVTTGMHSVLDVIAGVAAFFVILRMDDLWKMLLHWSESVANSWREWRIGPVRIINHGAYAGAAACVGVVVIDGFLPRGTTVVMGSIYVCSIVGAALWAQWVEGSPALLRPLGFYGGVVGGILGAIPASIMGVPLWGALAAIAVATPWIQAIGRLRCLVQGCCHGRAVRSGEGIRYQHPRSRVCRLAHLQGVPVHATPLYSILWNVWTGLLLLRLVSLGASSTLIGGVYLILSGAGRFVEEAYRGEPQTKALWGLRLYQWIAIVSMVTGVILTVLKSGAALPQFEVRSSAVVLALICGAATWFVAGVDFPESSRRFARLT